MNSKVSSDSANSVAHWASSHSSFVKEKIWLLSKLGEFSLHDWWEEKVITFEMPQQIIPLQCSLPFCDTCE